MPDYIGAAHGNLAWAAWRTGNFAAVHAHSQEALKAWRRLPTNYMFEWLGRWPLLGLSLVEENVAEAFMQAHELLKESQKRMPAALEAALEAALHAAATGEYAASRVFLEQAADAARGWGYL
jgi:cobalamin biosynthesis Mg chelatase CobN